MKAKKTIVSNIGNMNPTKWSWLYVTEGKEGEETFAAKDHLKDAAKIYGVPESLIKDIEAALAYVAEVIRDEVEKDLIDLFKKIEDCHELCKQT